MQYVQVLFNPWDRRSYTYENAGEPCVVGDQVVVVTPKNGETIAEVVGLLAEPPSFATKPIVRKLTAEELASAEKPF